MVTQVMDTVRLDSALIRRSDGGRKLVVEHVPLKQASLLFAGIQRDFVHNRTQVGRGMPGLL